MSLLYVLVCNYKCKIQLFEIPFYFHGNCIGIFFTGEEFKRYQSKELSKKKLNYKFKELLDRNYIMKTI